MTHFATNGLPLLIGSLPMDSHKEATELILEYTPEIPLWAQLPMYREEGMMAQFLPGMPGLTRTPDGRHYLDTSAEGFDGDYLAFYEDYLAVTEGTQDLDTSRFALSPETGKGFQEFLRQIDGEHVRRTALKGQVTGPFTFATGVKDENDRAIFYNDQLRDAAVKHLALNGQWQARAFARRGFQPVIFFDEPALAGFGTSAFITVSREDISQVINEVIQGVHAEGGIAGVHVCANTEWDLLLESDIDVISFDAYSFFDRFVLYPDSIAAYMNRGGILALGIVPTGDAGDIARETPDSLSRILEGHIAELTALGLSEATILRQSLITPSCGTGSLGLDAAKRVLWLTAEVSRNVRGVS